MAFLLNLMLRSKKAGLRVGEARVERLSRLNAEHVVGARHVEGVHVRMIDVQLCRDACALTADHELIAADAERRSERYQLHERAKADVPRGREGGY